jgi:hypothetical protein
MSFGGVIVSIATYAGFVTNVVHIVEDWSLMVNQRYDKANRCHPAGTFSLPTVSLILHGWLCSQCHSSSLLPSPALVIRHSSSYFRLTRSYNVYKLSRYRRHRRPGSCRRPSTHFVLQILGQSTYTRRVILSSPGIARSHCVLDRRRLLQ